MMHLYEIPAAVRYALEHGTDPDGQLTDLGERLLAEAEMSLEQRVDSYCALIREAKAEADAYNLEAERLKRLATTATNNENRLRELVRAAMEATGQTKVETPRFKARIQKNGQPKVTVPDVAAAPSDVVVRREMFMVDNSKVIELFKAGFDVSGWATVEYGSHLRIA